MKDFFECTLIVIGIMVVFVLTLIFSNAPIEYDDIGLRQVYEHCHVLNFALRSVAAEIINTAGGVVFARFTEFNYDEAAIHCPARKPR